ncbi:hypothetical protein [Sphingomonas immobilis]|uniref:Uncharacterized protein n=1 Tax=Sphingomonas immobilis TaxID=3063997 RepID=A0ABT9A1X9_9SPHN|nr:hypothetical protein [Sphingomonas sp. CA1-15]MDO7843260.1 hypothetical protein [Sphingomonas sp. CA1-15]
MQDLTDRIIAFVESVGIAVREGPIAGETFMPGMAVRGGTLAIDRETLRWPGDLLHEAGHIAVTDPALRAGTTAVSTDPSEEMAAIAWSYAAARAMALDPALVFHDGGYKGGGGWIADAFASGGTIGVPMLVWYGMTTNDAFPAMKRWLR